MKSAYSIVIALILTLGFGGSVWGGTQVYSITPSPSSINPFKGETTSIAVSATAGMTTLEIQVLSSDQTEVIREGLTLTESDPGNYATEWDGRDGNGAIVIADTYLLRVFSLTTTTYIGDAQDIVIKGLIISTEDTFVPTGMNTADIVLEGDAGQTGLKLYFGSNWQDADNNRYLPLTETSPGVYVASWNAVTYDSDFRPTPCVLWNGNYSIKVYDDEGNQSAVSGQITISGVKTLSADPSKFSGAAGQTTTITAEAAEGIDLEVAVTSYNSDTSEYETIKALPMTGTGDSYTTVWDGTDESGDAAAMGDYVVFVRNAGSGIRYAPRTNVEISAGVTEITPSADPFVLGCLKTAFFGNFSCSRTGPLRPVNLEGSCRRIPAS